MCAVCDDGGDGVVPYWTFPRKSAAPLAIDLCPRHFRRLIARRLGQKSFVRLLWQLDDLGLTAGEVFLLSERFYDDNGVAIDPVEVER